MPTTYEDLVDLSAQQPNPTVCAESIEVPSGTWAPTITHDPDHSTETLAYQSSIFIPMEGDGALSGAWKRYNEDSLTRIPDTPFTTSGSMSNAFGIDCERSYQIFGSPNMGANFHPREMMQQGEDFTWEQMSSGVEKVQSWDLSAQYTDSSRSSNKILTPSTGDSSNRNSQKPLAHDVQVENAPNLQQLNLEVEINEKLGTKSQGVDRAVVHTNKSRKRRYEPEELEKIAVFSGLATIFAFGNYLIGAVTVYRLNSHLYSGKSNIPVDAMVQTTP
ncbi:hypothetical protein G6011_08313 [Alternaria panax]|uniref:Uncharacterized protein n=1 Tax=Alternaria panax TaxID=48097 RepID=A0AAD4FHR9_9PLEO|nr:hypothetical protein G6011_08313 [Alternaria panax]